ncbi:MAG TPA: CRTAC1 family protein [Vicinamibacterales bacterium]|nr:CRTAC1 family protein [Vicinamibacterales bacterium]
MLVLFALAALPALADDSIFAGGFEANEAPPPAAWQFANVTTQSVDQTPDSSYRFDAVFTDFNNDGCYDLFVFGHEDPATSRLWVNRCDGSNTFTYAANDQVHHYIANPESPMGSGWITLLDVNGDGKQDFWLRHANILAARYINGTAPGTHIPSFLDKEDGCDDFCVFGDIDGDGTLDVIRNDRTVERITDRHVLYPAAGTPGRRIVGDVNGDGWPDLVEPEAAGYWQNDHGTLNWHSEPALEANKEPMVLADFDNSGSLDLVTLVGNDDTGSGQYHLYKNDGSGHFTDVSQGSGIDQLPFAGYFSSYGNLVAADFDNDGLPDLLVAGADYSPSVILLHNLGNLRFERVDVDLGTAGSGSEAFKSRAAVADFDNDGRLDIIKTQSGTNLGLWRNTSNTGGAHWMKVRVRGPGLNSDGLGADLAWYRPGTDTRITHMPVLANAQHAQTWVHAGLGANATADLLVRFPHDGASYRFQNLAADQEVIVFPNGCLIQHWSPGEGWPLTAPAGCPN